MPKLLHTAALLSVLAALPALADDPAPSPPPATSQFVELSAHDQVRQMGRGVNVIGYDPFWRDFGALDADNRLDPKWLNRLDWVVS